MGTLMFAIFMSFKWLTWWGARAGAYPSTGRSLGYMLAWPGMDANTFLDMKAKPPKPATAEWASAILSTGIGAMLLWGVARLVPTHQMLLAGWIGLIGLGVLVLFGVFHLLALFWKLAGVNACPIMNAPAISRSPSDFWGARWNLAFRDLAYAFIFRPMVPRLGIGGATMVTFLVSGLMHELVLSLPAEGGYGLPTCYFVLQGIAVLIEHSALGRRRGLDHGLSGWVYALLVVGFPAFWLFHPPFIARVMIPFMRAIGAL